MLSLTAANICTSLKKEIITMTTENFPVDQFPALFRQYCWQGKHALYGYPADSYAESCPWIDSLERRFRWLKINQPVSKTAAVYLMREMIQWGGSQNGALQKFDDGQGEVNLYELLRDTIAHLGTPELALRAALNIPGMGLTYASKLLRFLDPDRYGALDNRIRQGWLDPEGNKILQFISNGDANSMVRGYLQFLELIEGIRVQLDTAGIRRPECALPCGLTASGWRAADIEMAIFQLTEKKRAKRPV